MHIIHELTQLHRSAGYESRVVIGPGTMDDHDSGECIVVNEFLSLPTRKEKIMDAITGLLGGTRARMTSYYESAISAVPADYDGWIFIWNQPAVVEMFCQKVKNAKVCLFAVNNLFKTYSTWELNRVVRQCDIVLCISDFIASQILKRTSANQHKIKVLNPGVNLEDFKSSSTGITKNPRIVLFVGRMIKDKGADLLIKAAQQLDLQKLNAKIRIVGNSGFAPTDQLTDFEQYLRKLAIPLGNNIEFVESIDRKRLIEEYRRSSIFCLPSNWDEPCPLVISEAMASGLPVIASSRGGIKESGADAALYFDPPDVDRLSAHLRRLLSSDDELALWRDKALARARVITWANQYKLLQQMLSLS